MSRLSALLFPPACAGCGALLPFEGLTGKQLPDTALCKPCLAEWNEAKQKLCGICRQAVSDCTCVPDELAKAGCDTLRKLVYYRPGNRDDVQNRVIYHIKDRADRETARFLAGELSGAIRETLKERGVTADQAFLTYLPRGRGAVLTSGTDQAKELALAISSLLEIPVYPMLIRRFGHGKPQKLLSPAERIRNAKAAFRLRPFAAARGKCAIIVDDIVTSGAGMSVAVRLLRRGGAKRFIAVAVAADESHRNPIARQPELFTELDRLYAKLR